jgi:hypothetical protein
MIATVEKAYETLQAEATLLAGGLTDVAQRATVYRHMYRFSGGNHVFPLIAAHGALWSRGYLQLARRLAELLSWQYALSPLRRRQQLERLTTFENVLRDINRRVCVDTYVNLHLTARFDPQQLSHLVAAPLLRAMAQVHEARRGGQPLADWQKRLVFEAHFRNEQEHVVGPALVDAISELEWPLVRALALRPPIRFAYFGPHRRLAFRNFADRNERIAHGLRAYEIAAAVGWQQVESSLADYAVLPAESFTRPDEAFVTMRAAVLARC